MKQISVDQAHLAQPVSGTQTPMPLNPVRWVLPALMLLLQLLVFQVLVFLPGVMMQAQAAELRVAVAANFHGTLKQLVAAYKEDAVSQGDHILISAGSTGALYAQIRNGAPFDLFLAADQRRPEVLEEDGLTAANGRFTYAQGQLVLWSLDDALLIPEGEAMKTGLAQMLESEGRAAGYLSVANPDNAPYGFAARQVLESLGLWQTLNQQEQIIRAGNIGQVYSQVASGAASFGFIALSQAKHPDVQSRGSLWVPDASLYDPIIQQGVILARSPNVAASRRFVDWMQQAPAARNLIEAAGYRLAD